MIKRIIVALLVFISLFPCLVVMASDPVPFEEKEYYLPVVEELDLMVDGSITPILVNLTKEFDYIKMISISIVWRANAIDFDDYGLLPMLTNGTEFLYDSVLITPPIVCLKCYLSYAASVVIVSDDKNPVDNHFLAHTALENNLVPLGLKIREGHLFQIRINDNLTAVGSEHDARISGYRLIDRGYEFKQSFLEEVMDVDNPLELILWPIVLPLAFIFTAEPTMIIFGFSMFVAEIIVLRVLWVKMRM